MQSPDSFASRSSSAAAADGLRRVPQAGRGQVVRPAAVESPVRAMSPQASSKSRPVQESGTHRALGD